MNLRHIFRLFCLMLVMAICAQDASTPSHGARDDAVVAVAMSLNVDQPPAGGVDQGHEAEGDHEAIFAFDVSAQRPSTVGAILTVPDDDPVQRRPGEQLQRPPRATA